MYGMDCIASSECNVCTMTCINGVPGYTTCDVYSGCSCSHGEKIEGVSSNILLETEI